LTAFNEKLERHKDIVVTVRSQEPNNKALLANAIQKFNRSSLYAVQTCDEMVMYFSNTITGIIDQHLPLVAMKQHATDNHGSQISSADSSVAGSMHGQW